MISENFPDLPGQPGNQIQMLMNIAAIPDPFGTLRHFFQIHGSSNGLYRFGICGLDTDFQLNEPRPHAGKQFKILLPQQVRGNLKMKIGYPIVMLQNILPDPVCMLVAAVKSSVHKLYLGRLLFQEKFQFLIYKGQAAETQFFLHGRKTIAAGKYMIRVA